MRSPTSSCRNGLRVALAIALLWLAGCDDEETLERGRSIFGRDCAGCHGFDGRGAAGGSTVDLGTALDLERRRTILREGDAGGGMPGYAATYGAPDEAALLAWLDVLPVRRGPPVPAEAPAGAGWLDALGCAGCHEIPGAHRIVGPDLARAGDRFRKDWLASWLSSPSPRRPGLARMPDFRLAEREAAALAESLASGRGDDRPPSPELVEAGRQIFESRKCRACHRLEGSGGRLGPELTGAAGRLRAGWLREFLASPREVVPGTPMPRFDLAGAEVESLVAFLLDEAVAEPSPEAGDAVRSARIEIGRELFASFGCPGCHGGREEPVGPSLRAAGARLEREWVVAFLRRPAPIRPKLEARMPSFALAEPEARALAEAVAGLAEPALLDRVAALGARPARSDPEAGRRTFLDRDCHSCHRLGEDPLPAAGDYYYDGAAQVLRERWAPDLVHVGRLRRGAAWLQIHDPPSIAPGALMPRIGLTEAEVDAVLAFLERPR